MDNELKRMKEIPENSRNADKRIPHDPVRAQARELQGAGGSSSIRKDTGLRSLIQMPDEQSSFVKEWAEHWKQITGRPIDVVSDLEEIHDTVLSCAFSGEESEHECRAIYIRLDTYDILKRLMPDEAEISRLFHLEIEKAQQAIAEEFYTAAERIESSDLLLRSENIRPLRPRNRPQAKIFRGW